MNYLLLRTHKSNACVDSNFRRNYCKANKQFINFTVLELKLLSTSPPPPPPFFYYSTVNETQRKRYICDIFFVCVSKCR